MSFVVDKTRTIEFHKTVQLVNALEARADGSLARLLAKEVLGASEAVLEELGWPKPEDIEVPPCSCKTCRCDP